MLVDKIRASYRQFFFTLLTIPSAIDFFKENKLWKGLTQYGWASKFLMIIAAILGLKFIDILFDYISTEPQDPLTVASNMAFMMQDFAVEGYSLLFSGGMRYGVLFLLEVFIFHVSRKTLQILTKSESDISFDTFLKAQIRMLKVVLWAFIMETIATVIIKFAVGIYSPLEFIQPILTFGVACYYMGIPILDNYHEQFGMSIKNSFIYARNYMGVALAAGLFLRLAFYIPVVGPILSPIIIAVAVSLVMYELSDIHLLGDELEQKLVQVENENIHQDDLV